MNAGASPASDAALLQLRFFRDLAAAQRRAAFVALNVIPADLDEPISEATARRLFRMALEKPGAEQYLQGLLASGSEEKVQIGPVDV